MNFWLCIVSNYHDISVSICNTEDIVASASIPKNDANMLLLTTIDQLLHKQQLTLQDIIYLAVNAGPAPYTSLRIAITTVNSLAYAMHIPIVILDGLTTFLKEHACDNGTTIALLNAFNNELFYGIHTKETITTGYAPAEELFIKIRQNYPAPLKFIGNGVLLYHDMVDRCGAHDCTQDIPEYTSIPYLVKQAWHQWQHKEAIAAEAFPLYLKEVAYKNSVSVK